MTDRQWDAPLVALAVDLAILTVRETQLHVLLIERGAEPFRGSLALPGGFLRNEEESAHEAAVRELTEETGLDGAQLHLEQVRTYTEPNRDPRGRVVSLAYLAIAPDLPVPVAGTDAQAARWEPVNEVMRVPESLAFDHAQILRDAVERARAKLEYSTLAARFCSKEFTIGELRQVYEAVWGIRLDPRNFHRKVTKAKGFIAPTGAKRALETGRPAETYHRGSAQHLHPPMLRVSVIS